MLALDFLRTLQVGNGAGDLEDTTVGTGRELEALHCHAEHVETLGIRLCELMEHTFRHHGVAMDAFERQETFLLNLTGSNDALTNGRRWLAWFHLRQLRKRHRLYLAMDVDTVEQRAGDFVHVTLYLAGSADAMMGGIAIVAAGTGVHGGDEHERAGVLHVVFGTADGDDPVFQRLTHHLKDAAVELGKLVKEEDTIVGEADFTRLRISAATDKGDDISIRF